MKRLPLIVFVLALAAQSDAKAEVLTLACTGGPRPVKLTLDSQGEVLLDGVRQKHNSYSFVWHADVVAFRIEIPEAGVLRPAKFWQEWTISRDTGVARSVLRGRATAYASYECRDSATGERKF